MAELSPGVFGVTTRGANAAAAVQRGVEMARDHCARNGGEFDIVRSVIGTADYQLAFRCTRALAGLLTESDLEANSPGFRMPGSLP